MPDSLDTLLTVLKSNDGKTNQLTNIIRALSESNDSPSPETKQVHSDMLQIKINIINSLIPLLDENAAEMARFLIKLLTIITTVKQLKKNEN